MTWKARADAGRPGGPLLGATSLVLSLALALPAGAGVAAENADVHEIAEEVGRILSRSERSAAGSNERPAAELARLGPEAVEALCTRLASRGLENDGMAVPLTPAHEEVALAALELIGRRSVFESLDRMVGDRRDPKTRTMALRVVGRVGEAPDVAKLFHLASPGGEQGRDRPVERAFEKALAELLRKQPNGIELIDLELYRSAGCHEPAVLRALGSTGDARGLKFFAELLRVRDSHDLIVISQVQRLAAATRAAGPEALAGYLLAWLDDRDPAYCQAASLALAELCASVAVPHLIGLLGSESDGVRRNAHWALCRMSGRSLTASESIWRFWWAEEKRWYEARLPELRKQLDARNVGTVAAAIGEISKHPVFQHELARELHGSLRHDEATIRLLACEALGRLGSSVGTAMLVEALDDREPSVRARALSALRESSLVGPPGLEPGTK